MKTPQGRTISSRNVFSDLGFDQIEAEELVLRAFLLSETRDVIKRFGLTQSEVAKLLKIDQPRVSKLFNGQMSRFSTDKLISFLLKLGYDVHVELRKANKRTGRVSFSEPHGRVAKTSAHRQNTA